MTGAVLRAGAWPAVAGLTGAAVVVGGCGAAFPAAATMLLPVCFALLAPLAAGALVLLAAALRGVALPWSAAGNVLLGFAAACVARTRTGEPGATTGTAVVLVLMAPSLVPQVARWVRTFPAPGAGGPSSDPVWWTVLAVCAVATAISVGGRRLPQWRASVVIPRRPAPYGYAGPGLALAAASFVIFILRQLRPWR